MRMPNSKPGCKNQKTNQNLHAARDLWICESCNSGKRGESQRELIKIIKRIIFRSDSWARASPIALLATGVGNSLFVTRNTYVNVRCMHLPVCGAGRMRARVSSTFLCLVRIPSGPRWPKEMYPAQGGLFLSRPHSPILKT